MTQLGKSQPSRNPGRPSALTSTVTLSVVQVAELGGTQAMCAQAAGVSPQTFSRWMSTGRQDREAQRETPEARLVSMYEHARAERFSQALKTVKDVEVGAEKSADRLKAATWILERQGGYAEALKVEHSGPEGAPLTSTGPDWSRALALLSDEELSEVGRLQRRVQELIQGAEARAVEAA